MAKRFAGAQIVVDTDTKELELNVSGETASIGLVNKVSNEEILGEKTFEDLAVNNKILFKKEGGNIIFSAPEEVGASIEYTQYLQNNDGYIALIDDITYGEAGTVATINGKITAGTDVTITGSGTAADPYEISAIASGSVGNLQAVTDNGATTTNDISSSSTIFTNGNVTESSYYQLSALTMGYSSTGNYGWLTAGGASSRTNLSLNAGGGNVGVGTTNPTEKLEVNGNIKASGDITAGGGYLSSLEVTNDVTVNGAIGATSVVTSNDVIVGGDLDVTGNINASASSINADDMNLSGTLTANEVTVSKTPANPTDVVRLQDLSNFYIPSFEIINGAGYKYSYYNVIGAKPYTIVQIMTWDADVDEMTLNLPSSPNSGDVVEVRNLGVEFLLTQNVIFYDTVNTTSISVTGYKAAANTLVFKFTGGAWILL